MSLIKRLEKSLKNLQVVFGVSQGGAGMQKPQVYKKSLMSRIFHTWNFYKPEEFLYLKIFEIFLLHENNQRKKVIERAKVP